MVNGLAKPLRTRSGALSAALLASFFFCPPALADFQSGLEAFNRGAYEEALPLFEEAAENGDANAQYYLGVIYGQGRGTDVSVDDAIYWLSCAGSSPDGISSVAQQLKTRLLRDLPASERAGASNSAKDCPVVTASEVEKKGFLERFGSTQRQSGPAAPEGSFGSFMESFRSNGVVELFLIPGEVTIAAARETASLAGAKQTAYAIDSARLPGNDLIYMLIVLVSWYAFYKVIVGLWAFWRKLSEISANLEGVKEERPTLSKKKAARPEVET